MTISKKQTAALLKAGNWMIRCSRDGVGYGGFAWSPVGEWTTCPKWTPKPTCDSGGLFGQNKRAYGYCNNGSRIELCETDGPQIKVGADKIKVPKARIIALNWEIPIAFFRWASLDLRDCTGLTSLPEGLKVGGYLALRGCTGLTSLPEGLKVSGYLDLEGCTGLTSLPEGLKVGGYLALEGCTGLTSLPEGLKVSGSLALRGCTGLTSLPEGLKVSGSLDLPLHLMK